MGDLFSGGGGGTGLTTAAIPVELMINTWLHGNVDGGLLPTGAVVGGTPEDDFVVAGVYATDDWGGLMSHITAKGWPNFAEAFNEIYDSGNPFDAITSYDTSGEVGNVEVALENLIAYEYEPVEDIFSASLDQAWDKWDELFNTDDETNDFMTAYTTRAGNELAKQIANVTAGMFDLRATMTTQLGAALGGLVNEHLDRLVEVEARVKLELLRLRNQVIPTLAQFHLTMRSQEFQQLAAKLSFSMDAGKWVILANTDERKGNLEYELRQALWPLELFQYAWQGISPLVGGTSVPRAQTSGEEFMGSLMNAANFGMQAAQIGEEPNPGAGAIAGGALFLADIGARLFTRFA